MIENNNGNRYKDYILWETTINKPYNFEREGILNKYVAPAVYNTKNKILRQFLYVYEQSLIFMNKYIELLNNCHNFLKWNR